MYKIPVNEKALFRQFKSCVYVLHNLVYGTNLVLDENDLMTDAKEICNEFDELSNFNVSMLSDDARALWRNHFNLAFKLCSDLCNSETFAPLFYKSGNYNGKYYNYIFDELKMNLNSLCNYLNLTENQYFRNLDEAGIEDIGILCSWYNSQLKPKLYNRDYTRTIDMEMVNILSKSIEIDFKMFFPDKKESPLFSSNIIS